MGDAVKWGLLTAGIVVLIALIVVLPFNDFINVGEFGDTINTILYVCGSTLGNARGLINCFLTPFGRTLVTGMLIWFFGKWAIMIGIKITTWVYHFVFK